MKILAIKEHHLYDKTFHRGARFVSSSLAVYILRDYASKRLMLAHPQKIYTNRVGLSVGKKIGSAVDRNRAKRILREAYRAIRDTGKLATGYLIVIAARKEICGKKSYEVEKELRRAFVKLGLLPTQRTV